MMTLDGPPLMDTPEAAGAGPRAASVRWLVVAACVVLLVDAGAAALTIVSARATAQARAIVTAGLAYTQDAENLTEAILDAETGQRGYLLTGELSYLAPYRTALSAEPRLLATLSGGEPGDRLLSVDVRRLTVVVHAKLAELRETLQLRFQGHSAAALALVRTNRGSRLMAAIRLDTAAMNKRADVLIEAERKRSHAGQARANLAGLIAYLASGVLVVLMVLVLRRYATAERGRHVAGIAQLEAERLSDAKTGFLSRVSHELRTPLNAVLGFGQLLEIEKLDPDQRETLEQILAGGRHLLAIVNDLLDLSRVESGELRLSTEPVQLAEIIREARSLATPQAADRAVKVRPRDIPEALYVTADRQRLRQVLLNLISNAIKYNRPGGDVALSAGKIESGDIRIEITDTGIGISQEDIGRLFTPFERLDAASRGIEGTGLGLAVAKGLVETMNGSLTITSERGVGTTVWIELPVSAAPTLMPAPAADPARWSVRKSPQGALTVLYIEDNPSNVRLVEKILALRKQVTLFVATDGASGVTLARQHHPTVILLDLHLPDTLGENVLRQIQDDPATVDIPVIIVSADASPSQVHQLRAAGASGYLTKPFDVNELLEAIDTHSTPFTSATDRSPPDTGLLDRRMVASLHTLAANPNVGAAQVAEMLSNFRHDATEMLTSLHAALDDHDLGRVTKEAHRLAGGSGTFGAHEFRYTCQDIERHAKAGRNTDVRTLDATLDDLLARTWNALEVEFAAELSTQTPHAGAGAVRAEPV
jgi:signal transduction histidine kinase/DNA-binding response OmpR family regulator